MATKIFVNQPVKILKSQKNFFLEWAKNKAAGQRQDFFTHRFFLSAGVFF